MKWRLAWLLLSSLGVYGVAHLPETLHTTDPIDVFFRWSEADDVVAALLFLVAGAFLLLVLELRRERQTHAQHVELEKMREVSAFRTQFFNALAHELGNPITPLRIQARRLQDARPNLDPSTQKAVDIVDRNVARLAVLMTDVLDVARLESGKLRLQKAPINLVDLAKDTMASYEDLAREAHVSLEIQSESRITVDADRIRVGQVVANLLSNAIKFTPQDGHITIHLEAQPDEAVATVHDTGRGLSSTDAEKLFQPFMQVGQTPQQGKLTGTGLGLYICKGLIEQHGGRIWCQSPGPGQGSTFGFSLPIHHLSTQQTAPT